MQAMQNVAAAQSAAVENKTRVEHLTKHSTREQAKFQSQYESQILDMEREAKLIASTKGFGIVPKEDDLAMYSEDSGTGLESDRQVLAGPNFSSVIFNNSVAEAIDVARLNEVSILLHSAPQPKGYAA